MFFSLVVYLQRESHSSNRPAYRIRVRCNSDSKNLITKKTKENKLGGNCTRVGIARILYIMQHNNIKSISSSFTTKAQLPL